MKHKIRQKCGLKQNELTKFQIGQCWYHMHKLIYLFNPPSHKKYQLEPLVLQETFLKICNSETHWKEDFVVSVSQTLSLGSQESCQSES